MKKLLTQLPKHLGVMLILGLLINSGNAVAQADSEITRFYDTQRGYINPTSPEAWSMIKYGDAEVNLHTGTLGLSIPVYTFKNKSFTIPVSLNYASTGYKPNVQTGVLGAGWYLSAGGVITREVNGIPDESTTEYIYKDKKYGWEWHYTPVLGVYPMSGYCYLNSHSNWQTTFSKDFLYSGVPGQEYVITYKHNLREEYYETEPDVFHYNFMGYSGSFMMQPGKIVVFDCNTPPGEILVSVEGLMNSFTITTGDGYQYSFAKSDSSNSYDFEASDDGREVTSTWNLVRIDSSTGGCVLFEYDTDMQCHHTFSCIPNLYDEKKYERKKQYSSEDEETNDPDPNQLTSKQGISVNLVYTHSLRKITIPGEAEIEFDYETKASEVWDNSIILPFGYSSDANKTRRINQITAKNLFTNEIVKRCELDYNYDRNDRVTPLKRLTLLTSVKLSGEGEYKMKYYRETDNCAPINTFAIDWWGYYNNNISNNNIPRTNMSNSSFFPRHTNGVISSSYTARNPHFESAKYGMLERITYPTGGYSTFIYEPHNYSKKVVRENTNSYQPLLRNATGVTGGVRLATIIDHPGSEDRPPIYRDFIYENSPNVSSGILLWEPHVYMKYKLTPSTGYQIQREYTTTRQSFPYTKSNHIEYSRVVEKRYLLAQHNNATRTEHRFYSSEEHPDRYASFDYQWSWSNEYTAHSTPDQSISSIRYLYCQVNSNANLRGKLKSITYFDTSGKYTENYTYTTVSTTESGYITVPTSMLCQISGQRLSTESVFLRSTKKEHNKNGEPKLSDEIYNTYNSRGRLSKVSQTDSKGNTRVRHTVYIGDASNEDWEGLSGPPAYPLKETVYTQMPNQSKQVISSVKCAYTTIYYYDGEERAIPCLQSFSRGEIIPGTNPDNITYYEEIRNDVFDAKGHVLQSTDKSGMTSCYIWGYNGAYVVARIENATLAQITPLLSHDITSEPLERGLSSTEKDALHAIPGALTTMYDYKPLAGISEIRDPSNRKSLFEYDIHNRLIKTKDDKNLPVNEFRYHIVSDK